MTVNISSVLKLVAIVVGLGLLTMLSSSRYADTRPVMVQYYGEIQGDMQYFKLLTILREANYGQRIDIYMISPGGSVLHGNEIAAAMKESKGTIVYHVGSFAASMAAVLACQADKLDVSPQAVIMYHTIQGPEGAIINPTTPEEESFLAAAKVLTKDCKFLTKAEYDSLWVGGEVWLTGAELNERLAKEGV
jgi:hypothetical protein